MIRRVTYKTGQMIGLKRTLQTACSPATYNPPSDIAQSNPGYHLRSKPWGRNSIQCRARVFIRTIQKMIVPRLQLSP